MAGRSITVRVVRDVTIAGVAYAPGARVTLTPREAAILGRRGVVSLTREGDAEAGRYRRRDLRAEE